MIKKIRITCFFLTICIVQSLFAEISPPKDNRIVLDDNLPSLSDFLKKKPHKKLLGASAGEVSITTGSGTVRFVQAFFYGSGCTSLLGEASITDNTFGFSFSAGETISLNPSSAYTLATNKGITTGSIDCIKLFLNGSNESSDGIDCQTFDDISCSGSTCTSSQTKSVPWKSNPSFCQAQYLYGRGTTLGIGAINKCTVDTATGNLTGCALTASGEFTNNNPNTMAPLNGRLYAMDSDVPGLTWDNDVCEIDPSNGNLSCITMFVSGTTAGKQPGEIAMNSKYLYRMLSGGGTYSRFTIDPATGEEVRGEVINGAPNLFGVDAESWGIVINNGYAYVAVEDNSLIIKCTVNTSDGALESCGVASFALASPYGPATFNGYFYVVTKDADTLSKCTISSSDGSLSACGQESLPTGVAAQAISFTNTATTGYAYISTSGDQIIQCTVSAVDGSLSSCASTGTGFESPSQIAIY